MTSAPDYCRRVATYSVTAVNQGTKTFTIAESVATKITDEAITEITISGSTGNDGTYTIASVNGTTNIVVVEAIPHATADGQLELWNDLDAQTDKLPIVSSADQPFISATNETIYIGSATAWFGFGIILDTLGAYSTGIYYQFLKDASPDYWEDFTPVYDSTKNTSGHRFSKSGIVQWGTLTGWVAFTVNGQSGYWIRVKSTTVTTGATWFNMLRSVRLAPPLLVMPELGGSRYYRDVNNEVGNTDMTYYSVTKLTVQCRSIACSMEDLNNLWFWMEQRNKLWLIDAARTDPVDYTKDAFWRNLIGRISHIDPNAYSPHKMQPHTFSIVFEISAVISASNAITDEVLTDQGEGVWEFERAEGNATNESGDGGDVFTGV